MVWVTQEELHDARQRPQNKTRPYTLFADAYGLFTEHAPVPNDAFLEALVLASRIGPDTAKQILGEVQAGAQIPIDMHDIDTSLFYSSLPETFAYLDIATLLMRTGKWSNPQQAAQRLDETGKVIKSIVSGLTSADGTGLYSAFWELGMRHERLDKAWGTEPRSSIHYINQVSLAFTLLTFSLTPFQAMQRAGKAIPDETQRTAWLTMWNIIGSFTGIEAGGRPGTLDEANAMLAAILQSPPYVETPKDGDGHTLTNLLVTLNKGKVDPFFLWGGDALMTHLGFTKGLVP